jgi:hypothetical protein
MIMDDVIGQILKLLLVGFSQTLSDKELSCLMEK